MSTCTQYCHILIQIPNVNIYQSAYNTYKLTILMQGNDIEMNPDPTHRSITTVQENFHQGDQKEFKSNNSAGKQCVTNSIMAIIYSTVLPIKYWEPKHLDEILQIGDRLYRRINSPHYYLLISDIPDVVTEFGEQYSVQINGEMFELIGGLLPNGIGQRLDDVIRSMIQESKWTNGVLCIGQAPNSLAYSRLQGGSACALLVTENNYCIFDPHSRDRNGKVAESGASILLHFTTIRQFCSYIQVILILILNCNYYENTPASVNSLLFERYATDQNRRQAEKNETKVNQETSTSKLTKREREAIKCEQNHLRIVKKCQELTYSNKEKTKNAESKQEKRSDPQVREHEARVKRQNRSNPQVSEKDREYMRQKRNLTEVKEKEAQLKRQKRNDQVKEMEAQIKRQKKKDPQVREHEAKVKREKRSNP